MTRSTAPVTADDLDHVIQLAIDTLRKVPADAWFGNAGSLEWDRWEVVEHVADDFFTYAAQLGPKHPSPGSYVPLAYESRRDGGPTNSIWAEPDSGPEGLLQLFESCGAILVSIVRTSSPDVRAHHGYGAADPAGFAAMGIVETLVHVHDVTDGLEVRWEPPADVCDRVLNRLFPDVPATLAPWPALLWATGRAESPEHPRRTKWRWYGEPR